jgi:hypothetical protein
VRILAIVLVLIAVSFSAVAGGQTPARSLAIIFLDACRADYLNLTSLPNIENLKTQGTSYSRAWTGQMINNTPPAHATLGTGVFPRRHGVVDFTWRDPLTNLIVNPTSLDAVINGELGQVIYDANVPTVFNLFKKKYPLAKALTISSNKFYAAAAMGNYSADWIIFADWLTGKYRPFAVLNHRASSWYMDHPQLNSSSLGGILRENDWVIQAASLFIRKAKPKIVMINLPESDDKGHLTGGIIASGVMTQVMANIDLSVGKIIQAYKDAGIFDQTIFVVTADHGMIPNCHQIDLKSLRELLMDSKVGLVKAGPSIWIENTDKAGEVATKIAQRFPKLTGVYYKTRDISGGYKYLPAKDAGSLENTYQYLLSTVAGPNGPDINLFAPENTVFEEKMFLYSHGSHTETTWLTQHIPMIVAGPGVKKGLSSSFPARLVDVAPTVLTLTGVTPDGMDGVVLADCLESPTEEQINAQKAIEPSLLKFQNQLMSLPGGL